MKVHIRDAAFLPFGNKRLHGKDDPQNFKWVNEAHPDRTVFLTDTYISRVDEIDAKRKVAWLLEPPGFRQGNYDYVVANQHKFDWIVTYVQWMHDALPQQCLYYDMAYTLLTPEQYTAPLNKTKDVSFLLSPKDAATGHKFRHNVHGELNGEGYDVFGIDQFVPKFDFLQNYRYSITIMGEKYNWCIDEKIIDCFLARTIPIFWGCPDLPLWIDPDGVWSFDSIDELRVLLLDATQQNYDELTSTIQHNYEYALERIKLTEEDTMFERYPFLFTD